MEIPSDTINAVKAANAEFYRAIEVNAIDRMEAIWAHEENVRCIHPGGDLIIGWARVRESWERIFEDEPQMRISPADIYIYQSGNLAWVTCIENITVFQESSFDSIQAVATNLFVYRNAKWLMQHHHASPIPIILSDNASDTIQ